MHALQNLIVKANNTRNEMYPLPDLWSLRKKTEELRKWSKSIPAGSTGPLKTLREWMLHGLSELAQANQFRPSDTNRLADSVERRVLNSRGYSAQFTAGLKDDESSIRPQTVVKYAMNDIGIPEPCTDIVYLLVDDILHMSDERVDRYYRVWCSSGTAMLVSSTTTKVFNTSGYAVEVSCHAIVISDGRLSRPC
jgi:hypothetical protein